MTSPSQRRGFDVVADARFATAERYKSLSGSDPGQQRAFIGETRAFEGEPCRVIETASVFGGRFRHLCEGHRESRESWP